MATWSWVRGENVAVEGNEQPEVVALVWLEHANSSASTGTTSLRTAPSCHARAPGHVPDEGRRRSALGYTSRGWRRHPRGRPIAGVGPVENLFPLVKGIAAGQ